MRRAATFHSRLAVSVLWILAAWGLPASRFDEADAATERCLSAGRILRKVRNLEGVTRPELFVIECNGKERRAVVKKLDKVHRGVQRFADGTWEMNFSDSYRYERAAYLLDRELGLEMVPVAVIRQVKRRQAAVIEWIDGASHVEDAPEPPTGPQVAELARQKAIMRLFDALIYNIDRNQSNYLVDDEDWRLYLIDHSRAFRETSALPESFMASRVRLSRDLYERLGALNEESLKDRLEGLISASQVRKMLDRRDKILEKIRQDCQQWGEEVVFSG